MSGRFPSTAEIKAAAKAIRRTYKSMYGEVLDLDDAYQLVRSALAAAEAEREGKG
jgi:hypothetical protein